jgi:hypothetical protein
MSGLFKVVTKILDDVLGVEVDKKVITPPPVVEAPKAPEVSSAEDVSTEDIKKKEDLEVGRSTRRKRNQRSSLLASFKEEDDTKVRSILLGGKE